MKLENNFIELPNGWSNTCIGDVAEVVMGQSPPSDTYNYEKDGLPFFKGKLNLLIFTP
jgi:type I restriction enzyme, S subunit